MLLQKLKGKKETKGRQGIERGREEQEDREVWLSQNFIYETYEIGSYINKKFLKQKKYYLKN